MSFTIETWGRFACFTRPEFSVERYSYEVITPSAARSLFEAIYWHPGMRWVIDRIMVCNPIRFESITRNEVIETMNLKEVDKALKRGQTPPALIVDQKIHTQRSNIVLRDVRYIIQAHIELDSDRPKNLTERKITEIFYRRLLKGQTHHSPYFGIREYCANIKYCSGIPEVPKELMGVKDLGQMLYDRNYSNPERPAPIFFHAVMKNGVIDVPYIRIAQKGAKA